jgi:hypothetical protein
MTPGNMRELSVHLASTTPAGTKRSDGKVLVMTVTSFDVLVGLAMLGAFIVIVLAVRRW